MDHAYIEEHNIADRYLMGKLSDDGRARFEEHFMGCAECLDRLETADEFRAPLRATETEEASSPEIPAV